VAETHALAAGFAATCHRPALDLPLLLDESLAVIAPFLNHAGHACLNAVRDRIYQALPAIPRNTDTYGICTGDVNLTNCHVDGKGQLTLFDFDQCGYGYRAFEIGKFFSSVHRHGQDLETAFLAGYQQVRPLSRVEHEAIPYFAIAALIWVMAIHAGNADLIGYKRLEPPFWERRLAVLKERVEALPG
jgi:Ser/Thr protein kinase RdoA (MazF antagonist)